MRILLIRHGEPNYEIDSLTPTGFIEADILSDRISAMDIKDFYCSPLGRAVDTARPTLKKVNAQATILPWLAEFKGTIEDKHTGEPKLPWDLPTDYWTDDKDIYSCNTWLNSKSFKTGNIKEIYKETTDGIDALLSKYGFTRSGNSYTCENNTDETIAIFCHYGMSMAIISHLTGLSLPLLWHCMFMPTTSVTTLATSELIKGDITFRCLQIGDTSHLYKANQPVSKAGILTEVHD